MSKVQPLPRTGPAGVIGNDRAHKPHLPPRPSSSGVPVGTIDEKTGIILEFAEGRSVSFVVLDIAWLLRNGGAGSPAGPLRLAMTVVLPPSYRML